MRFLHCLGLLQAQALVGENQLAGKEVFLRGMGYGHSEEGLRVGLGGLKLFSNLNGSTIQALKKNPFK